MSAYRAVLLAMVVVGAAGSAVLPAAGAVGSVDATVDERSGVDGNAVERSAVAASVESSNESNTTNASLGTDISSFMQSSVSEASGAVDTGMWSAEFDATANRSARVTLVDRKTEEMRTELESLREQKQELLDAREAGEVSQTAFHARMSSLIGRIDALESSLDATTARARSVNASVAGLDQLRTDLENVSGPEIAAVARNTSGVGVGAGLQGDGNGPPNEVGGPPGNSTGPPGDAGPPDRADEEDGEIGGLPLDGNETTTGDVSTGDPIEGPTVGNGTTTVAMSVGEAPPESWLARL